MVVSKIICDKCGREIKREHKLFDKDLCSYCEMKFKAMFDAWMAPTTTQAAQEEASDITVDKVKANEIKAAKKATEKAREEKEKKDDLVADSCARVLAEINGEDYPEKKDGRGYIDWDKAIKLKLEGLKNREIADACGTTLGTINACIYNEMRKRGIK